MLLARSTGTTTRRIERRTKRPYLQAKPACSLRAVRQESSEILDGIAHARDSELAGYPPDRAHDSRMDMRMLVRIHMSQFDPRAPNFFELGAQFRLHVLGADASQA